MRLLLAAGILVALALAVTSRRFYALRRTRLGAALTTGGWLLVAVGMLFGPHGLALLQREQVLALHPLILFCLGLVGMMVGLQLDRRLPAALPALVTRLTIIDTLGTFLLMWLLAWAVMHIASSPRFFISPVAILLAICALGWSPEVRSLRHNVLESQAVTSVMRAVSGLSSILTVVLYGMLIKSMVLDTQANLLVDLSAGRMLVGLAVSLVIAAVMGLTGRWLLGVAGRSEGEFLLVMLGLISLAAGAAATLAISPLTVCMLLGAVIANLRHPNIDKLKRVIVETEQPVAMVLMMVAGLLANPHIGAAGWLLVPALLAGRAAVKLGLMRWRMQRETRITNVPGELTGMMRQTPLAIALAMAFAIGPFGRASTSSLSGDQVLMVVIATGLLTELWPLATRGLMRLAGRPAAKPAGASA